MEPGLSSVASNKHQGLYLAPSFLSPPCTSGAALWGSTEGMLSAEKPTAPKEKEVR